MFYNYITHNFCFFVPQFWTTITELHTFSEEVKLNETWILLRGITVYSFWQQLQILNKNEFTLTHYNSIMIQQLYVSMCHQEYNKGSCLIAGYDVIPELDPGGDPV